MYFISCINSNNVTGSENSTQLTDSIIYADFNGMCFDSLTSVISQNGHSLKLLDLPNKELLLFVRYSNYGCKDCINYVVNGINKRNLNPSVCFLIAEVPIMDLHVIQRMERLNGAYRLDSFDIDFDSALTPYMFQINHKGEVCHLYIPREENPNAFDRYLRKFQESRNELHSLVN